MLNRAASGNEALSSSGLSVGRGQYMRDYRLELFEYARVSSLYEYVDGGLSFAWQLPAPTLSEEACRLAKERPP